MPEERHNTTPYTRNAKRRPGQKPTPEERKIIQQKFLDSFRLNANITLACKQAGIDRSQVYRWQEKDEEFSFQFKQAEADANDMLLAAAWQRAVRGVEKPVVSMGKQVFVQEDVNGRKVEKPLMERVYSDTVLLRLMSWRIPGFSEKTQVEHSGPGGGPIQIQRNPNLKNLSDEELDALEIIARKARGEGSSGDNS